MQEPLRHGRVLVEGTKLHWAELGESGVGRWLEAAMSDEVDIVGHSVRRMLTKVVSERADQPGKLGHRYCRVS